MNSAFIAVPRALARVKRNTAGESSVHTGENTYACTRYTRREPVSGRDAHTRAFSHFSVSFLRLNGAAPLVDSLEQREVCKLRNGRALRAFDACLTRRN